MTYLNVIISRLNDIIPNLQQHASLMTCFLYHIIRGGVGIHRGLENSRKFDNGRLQISENSINGELK